MALITVILEWFNTKIKQWGCKRYGHCGARTIETYNTIIRIKNWVVMGKKIVFIQPYKQLLVNGKHKCTACGAVFLGVIVKEESFHDKPHGTP